jgi:hypothetical protein
MYPGLIQPTVISLRPGATSPREDAFLAQQEMNNTQTNLIKLGGKRCKSNKYRNRKRRGGGNVVVPQFQMPYTPTGTTTPNGIIADTSKNSMQRVAWSANDSEAASLKGGSRRRCRKGGNPDWNWGCYSGGKTYRKHKKHNRKSRKSRKCRR